MFKKDTISHKVKDYVMSNKFFTLYKDYDSGILWTDVDKSHDHLKYYLSNNYIPHSDKKGLFGTLYLFLQRTMFTYKRVLLRKALKESNCILDYGSGDGKFAGYLKKKGKKVFTYDPLKSNSLQTTDQPQGLDFQADMMMMWHVLEHIPDLQKAFPHILEKLNKTGFLVIAVPNRDCFDAKHYKNKWAAWDVPRHLYHFNHKSLVSFMSTHKLSLVLKRPLILDSFYVSYLSEKYKKNPLPLLSGLVIGLVSNCLAVFTSNFSSSVYVFRRN